MNPLISPDLGLIGAPLPPSPHDMSSGDKSPFAVCQISCVEWPMGVRWLGVSGQEVIAC